MKKIFAFGVLGMLLATAASAQQGTQARQPPPVAGSITLGVTVEESTAVAIGYRASKLIGAIVYNLESTEFYIIPTQLV